MTSVDLLDSYRRSLTRWELSVIPIVCVLIGLFGWYGAIGIAKSVVWIMENLNPFHDDH